MLSLLEKPQLGDLDTTDRFTVQPGLAPGGAQLERDRAL